MPAARRHAVSTPWLRRRAILLLLAMSAGCSITDPYTSTLELPTDPGIIVPAAGTISPASTLVWSRDGRQLTFEMEDRTLATLDITTGVVRSRDGPRDEHDELSAANAGDALYFLADRHAGLRVAWRLPPQGGAVQLTDRAPGSRPIVPGDGALVLGGPGDTVVAHINDPDSLFLVDNATGTRRFVASGCARAVAFSPDGGRLLCKRPSALMSESSTWPMAA